jgi:hypothetical protein
MPSCARGSTRPPAEIEKLIAVAKRGRYGQRDATLILDVQI